MVEGILFEQVEDSRQDWKVKHSISEILTVVMCGVSAVVAGGLLYKSPPAFLSPFIFFVKAAEFKHCGRNDFNVSCVFFYNELYCPQGRSRFGRLHGGSFHHVAVDFLSMK